VFVHTDAVADVRNLPGFTKVEEYGTFKPIHDMEFGSVRGLPVHQVPLLQPFLAGGSATLNGMPVARCSPTSTCTRSS
jgi:N4-gp56 family major capsid protein